MSGLIALGFMALLSYVIASATRTKIPRFRPSRPAPRRSVFGPKSTNVRFWRILLKNSEKSVPQNPPVSSAIKARMTGGGFPAFRHEQNSRITQAQESFDGTIILCLLRRHELHNDQTREHKE